MGRGAGVAVCLYRMLRKLFHVKMSVLLCMVPQIKISGHANALMTDQHLELRMTRCCTGNPTLPVQQRVMYATVAVQKTL